ncbi:MAG: hypothetical protein KC502_14950 [Myxococcales bacterium]|nr:hypothetical protein [Myxococcales bacterium]
MLSSRSLNAALIAVGCLSGTLLLLGPLPCCARPKAKAMTAKAATRAATKHYKAGRYQKASELYRSAFKATKRPAYLFNAARAAQRGFLFDAATRDFNRYLELKPKDPKGKRRARLHLKEIAEIQARAAASKAKISRDEPTAAAVPPPNIRKSTATAKWKAPASWALVGVGTIAAGLGAWWALSATADGDELDEKLGKNDSQGIIGISHAEAEAQRQDINSRLIRSYVSTGVGLAALGAGVWMLMSQRQSTALAVVPTRDGLQTTWLVRF